MTSKVPEIKHVKSYCSNRKNTLMKKHCVDQPLLFIPEKQLRSEQLFITGLKEKKQVDEFLLFVKLYFSSTFNYAQLSYNNLNKKFPCRSAIICSHPTSKKVAPCVSSRTHPKTSKKKRRKKPWVTGDLERARPKEMFPLTFKKKVEVEPKNRKNIWFLTF